MARSALQAAAAAACAAVALAAPNFVVFLTDDQDILMDSLNYMPKTRQLLVENGMSFPNNFASVPVCCPSRASFWTGLHQQNTGVFNNSVAGQCGGPAFQNGPEQRALPVLLKQAGYVTSFAGKYSNTYGQLSSAPRPGWDNWQALFGNSIYYNYRLSNNGTVEQHGHDEATDYLPRLVANRTWAWMDAVAGGASPFLAAFSVPACHQPADPETKYSTLYPGITAPRQPNFNTRIPNTHWFEATQGVLGPLDANEIDFVDLLYRRRLQTLATVDDIVAGTVALLASKGVLADTYLVYTSDNGYHLGQGGLGLDKRQPWDYDARVPLLIAGPGVAKNAVNPTLVQHVDVVPTILDLAGVAPLPPTLDGLSLAPLLGGAGSQALPAAEAQASEALVFSQPSQSNAAELSSAGWTRQTALYSYHGEGQFPGANAGMCAGLPQDLFCENQQNVSTPPFFNGQPFCSCQDAANNTYACVRTVNASVNVRYCEFTKGSQNGFVEFFDLNADPYEMANLAPSANPGVLSYYGAILAALKGCSGAACNAY